MRKQIKLVNYLFIKSFILGWVFIEYLFEITFRFNLKNASAIQSNVLCR